MLPEAHNNGSFPTTSFATGYDTSTGAHYRVPASEEVVRRFASTAVLVGDVTEWPVERLIALRLETRTWEADACERLLAVLGTHGSEDAFDMLAMLRPELPESLKPFAEIAFAKSLGALGFNYAREPEDTAPTVVEAHLEAA